MMLDVLVLNYNDAATTIQFVRSIFDFSNVRKILVVDNHSSDDSFCRLQSLSNEKIDVVSTDRNGGYGYGNNFGIKYLKEKYESEYILLCNPDVIVKNETLFVLEHFLENNRDYAIVSALMLDAKLHPQYNSAYKKVSTFNYLMHVELFYSKMKKPLHEKIKSQLSKDALDVYSVAGSMFLMRSEDMIECGMYDENVFLYFEELVLGKKIEKIGKKIALICSESFVHNHSVSISKTYRKVIDRHNIYLKSYRYVLKHYFSKNPLVWFTGMLLSKVSFFEVFMLSFLRRK